MWKEAVVAWFEALLRYLSERLEETTPRMCYAQRSKTLTERKKRPQRVVALEKQLQREIACCGSF